jgi:signal transduction histidine kinase
VLLFILGFMFTVALNGTYEFVRKRELEQAVERVRQNINNPDLQEILLELQSEQNIIAMARHEYVLYPVQLPPDQLPWRRELPDGENTGNATTRIVFDGENTGNASTRIVFNRSMSDVLTRTEDFTLSDGTEITVAFAATISALGTTMHALQIQLYIVSFIMFILSIIVAAIISKKISKPIEEINNSAKKLAAGNFNTRFDGKGFLEIKELSDTLNKTAKELSKVENLRRELMANVSHDLRTPLALIYSYAEMMHDFPDEITRAQTKTIIDETKRMTSLVNDILDISQLESGGIVLKKSEFNLTASISKTIAALNELVKADGYRINFTHENEIKMNADEIKITQAFYNLLINAITYSGNEKEITVRQIFSDASETVRIEVEDFGEGISAENLPYVWERYYKIEKNHKRPITGTGLGLSIVKRIIENHGGKYGVISELGKGSMFWLELSR